MKKLCILKYGCDAHLTDFRQLVENLREEYEITHYPNEADLIVEYFCFIGEERIKAIAKELIYIKLAKKESAIYIAVGCLVDVVGAESFKGYADYAFGKKNWVDNVTRVITSRKAQNKFFIEDNPCFYHIDIVGGCVRKGGYCTFCKQNYMHVPVKSMPMEEVLKRAEDITKNSSVSTIILDGLNTCNYGIDDEDHKQKLHILVKKLSEIPTVKWIHISCLTVGDMYEELIEEIANNKKVCEIVLGIQSGSNKMLEVMNVHSTVEQIQHCLDRLSHKRIVTIAVISHPGETLETVQETIDFVRKNNLWYIQMEGFSCSKYTPAAEMEQLAEEEYDKYLSMAKDAVKELSNDFFKTIMDTWVEGYMQEVNYYSDDVMQITVFTLKYNFQLSMTVRDAKKTKYYKMMEELNTGDKVRCKVSEVFSDRPNHMVVCFSDLEVI